MAASVQDNVTFGSEFVSSLYSAVVQQCQLESDIASFPAGSQTQLGERGITLSGGQKARIGLARAVYACLLCARQENTHPVLLLDDPLSAVDVTVGRAIVEECICGLAKDVTRVLVTHQVQFAEACDHVLVLGKDGSVVTYGTYADLFAGGLPAELQHSVFHDTADAAESNRGGLDSCAHEQGHVGSFDRQLEAKDSSGPETISTAHQQGTADSKPKTGRHSYALSSTPVAERGDEDGTGGGAAAVTEHKVIADEEREEGRVQLSLLLTYVKADGTWFRVVAVGLLVGAAQTTQIVADWYLSQWMALSPVDRQSTRPLAIYSGLIALFIVVAASRVVLFMRAMIDAARVLHTKALSAVLGASLAFFDTQPVGRILNRFSRDIGYLDELLPATLLDAVSGLTMCLGSIVLVSGVNPWLFLAAGPVVILMALVRMFYIRSAREVKRIEGMMRSPVYAHLSTTLEGLVVIRSHDTMVTRFRGDFHAAQDEHTKAFFIFVTVSRWLGARLDAILVTFIVVTTFVTVALRDSINPGEVALGLVYTLQVRALVWLVPADFFPRVPIRSKMSVPLVPCFLGQL